MSKIPTGIERRLDFWLRRISDSLSTTGNANLIAALQDVELSVDENKAQVALNTIALGLLDLITDFEIVGAGVVRTITIAGSGGSIGLDIDIGAGDVEYDENDAGTVETTIDAWLVTHAANILANQGITATKASASTILLTGTEGSGNWKFTDGSVTMTATAGYATVTGLDTATLASLASLETQVDLVTAAVVSNEVAVALVDAAVDLVKTAVDENKAKVVLNTTAVDAVTTAVISNEAAVALVDAAVDLVKTAVDENKAKVVLNTAEITQLISQSFATSGFEIGGQTALETITVAGGSGTLGIDITDEAGTNTIAYDEAFAVDVETTIDNWLVTNAANILANSGITATKASVATILLTGGIRAGKYVFADGGATMTATSGGQTDTWSVFTGPYDVIEVLADTIFHDTGTVVTAGDNFPFGYSFSAGTRIVGNFTDVQLASGKVLLYPI